MFSTAAGASNSNSNSDYVFVRYVKLWEWKGALLPRLLLRMTPSLQVHYPPAGKTNSVSLTLDVSWCICDSDWQILVYQPAQDKYGHVLWCVLYVRWDVTWTITGLFQTISILGSGFQRLIHKDVTTARPYFTMLQDYSLFFFFSFSLSTNRAVTFTMATTECGWTLFDSDRLNSPDGCSIKHLPFVTHKPGSVKCALHSHSGFCVARCANISPCITSCDERVRSGVSSSRCSRTLYRQTQQKCVNHVCPFEIITQH